MQWELTAMFWPVDGGFAARTEEFPDIDAHGATLDEARENLRAAVRQTLQSRRAQAEHELAETAAVEQTMVISREADGADLRFTYPGT
jgi:predicted RNase H-like HicB family nuclease